MRLPCITTYFPRQAQRFLSTPSTRSYSNRLLPTTTTSPQSPPSLKSRPKKADNPHRPKSIPTTHPLLRLDHLLSTLDLVIRLLSISISIRSAEIQPQKHSTPRKAAANVVWEKADGSLNGDGLEGGFKRGGGGGEVRASRTRQYVE